MKQLHNYLRFPYWLIFLIFLLFLLRLPSFFEPYYFEPEMNMLLSGKSPLNQEFDFLSIIGSLTGSVYWVRVVLCIWMILTTVVFWKFMQTLFKNSTQTIIVGTTTFAVLTSLPSFGVNLPHPELFVLLPLLSASLLILQKKDPYKDVLISVLFVFATAVSTNSFVIVLGIVLSANLIDPKTRKKVRYASVLLLPAAITFLLLGGMKFSFHQFSVPFMITILVSIVLVFLYKKSLTKQFVFASSLLLFSLVAVLSDTNTAQNTFILTFPFLSLMIAMLIGLDTIEQSLTLFPITIALLVAVYSGFTIVSSGYYYYRFFSFVQGTLSQEKYLESFSNNTSNYYKIAAFIVSTSTQNHEILVLGERPATILALSKRSPSYLSSGTERVSLNSNLPELIVSDSKNHYNKDLQNYIYDNYMNIYRVEDIIIWKRMAENQRALLF